MLVGNVDLLLYRTLPVHPSTHSSTTSNPTQPSFILANTEQLHERIEELQERIASLESTLSTLYTSTRSALDPFPHPLLTDELLNIKTPIGAEIVGSLNPRLRQRSAAPAPGGNSGLRELNVLGNQQQHVSGAVGGGGGEGQESDGEHAGELTESFGTLALGEGSEGKSTFFGNAAGALFLLGVSFCFQLFESVFFSLYHSELTIFSL